MEKNDFMLLNDLIYQLYTEDSLTQLKPLFLRRLKQIIPYSYASIIMAESIDGNITLKNPVCNPPSFQKAELEYLKLEDMDHTQWILYSTETVLVKESDIMNDNNRLMSPIYRDCYRHYDIFDTLQMSIVYEKKPFAVLTIYRTKNDGPFSSEEMFYLQAISKHLNYIFYSHIAKPAVTDYSIRIADLKEIYGLTRRESEILGYIFRDMNNAEILEKIDITEHTLQKHIQNLYQKLNVSTRWDLLKFKTGAL